MGNLFCSDSKGRKDDGGQKAAPPPKPKRTDDTDRGILQLKTQRDKLQIQRKNVMKMVEQDVEKAKQYLKETPPNKKFAGFCLKKKAHHLKMVENCDNSMMTLLQLIDNVEMARVQAEVVKALEKGNSCLKEMRDEVSVDRVQLLMDETEEFREWVGLHFCEVFLHSPCMTIRWNSNPARWKRGCPAWTSLCRNNRLSIISA